MPPMVAPAMMPAFLEPSPPPLDGEGSADVVEAGKGGTVPPDDELSIVVGVGVDVDDSSEEVDSSVDVNKRVILGVVAPIRHELCPIVTIAVHTRSSDGSRAGSIQSISSIGRIITPKSGLRI